MRSVADYTDLLYNLAPPGIVLSPEKTSTSYKFLSGLAAELLRVDQKINDLIIESDPRTATLTIDARYAEAGLPDPCRGMAATYQEKKNDILGKWTSRGGASAKYFIDVVNAYGIVAKIKDAISGAFYIDETRIESRGIEDSFVHTWQISFLNLNKTFFRAGESLAGEALETSATTSLACIIEKLKPAHTTVLYNSVLTQAEFDLI